MDKHHINTIEKLMVATDRATGYDLEPALEPLLEGIDLFEVASELGTVLKAAGLVLAALNHIDYDTETLPGLGATLLMSAGDSEEMRRIAETAMGMATAAGDPTLTEFFRGDVDLPVVATLCRLTTTFAKACVPPGTPFTVWAHTLVGR